MGGRYGRYMARETKPRVRLASIPGDGVMVVRGDELDDTVLAEDASRFRERFSDWGQYGVSAFYAVSDDEIEALCQARLIRFETVVVFRRVDLEAAGVEIVPTFRRSRFLLQSSSVDRSTQTRCGVSSTWDAASS